VEQFCKTSPRDQRLEKVFGVLGWQSHGQFLKHNVFGELAVLGLLEDLDDEFEHTELLLVSRCLEESASSSDLHARLMAPIIKRWQVTIGKWFSYHRRSNRAIKNASTIFRLIPKFLQLTNEQDLLKKLNIREESNSSSIKNFFYFIGTYRLSTLHGLAMIEKCLQGKAITHIPAILP